MNVTFSFVGGPWDGQTISTNAEDEASVHFATALYAMTRQASAGATIPMLSPAQQQNLEVDDSAAFRASIRPYEYCIHDAKRTATEVHATVQYHGRTSQQS